MRQLNDDDKAFVKELLRGEAWKIIKEDNEETIGNYRRMATDREVKLEDRLWYSALAQGHEDFLQSVEDLVK